MLNFYSRLHRKALPLESKAWLSSTISKPVTKGVDRSSTDKKEGSNANEESLAQPADNFEWRTWIGESNPISFVKAPVKGEKIYIPDIRMFVPNNQKKILVDKPARATEHDDQVMRDSSVPSEFGCKVSHAEKSEEQRKALEIEEQRRYDAKRNKYLSEEESRVSVRKEYLREPPNREGNKCYVKFLCPSLVTEAMHDSGEMWVNEICDISGASIKISPKGHFYPTTTDRVISVSGDYEEVKSAVNILVKDLIKPPGISSGRLHSLNSPFIRILVPKVAVPTIVGDGFRVLNRISNCILEVMDDNGEDKSKTELEGGNVTANSCMIDTKESFLYIGCQSRKISCLIFGVQMAVRQVLMNQDTFPYYDNSVLYGHEKVEPAPPRGSINLNPVTKYTGIFATLVQSHKIAKKKSDMIEISRLRGSAPSSAAVPNNLPKLNAYKSRQTSSRGNRFYLEKCLLERNLKNSDNDSEFIHSV